MQKTLDFIGFFVEPEVANALRAIVKLNKNPKFFFWTGESAVQSAVSNWRRRIAEVFTRTGIVDGHTHRFRDTFAVELLVSGTSLENVSRLLGHTSTRVTERSYNPWLKVRQDRLDTDLRRANDWLAEAESSSSGKVPSLKSSLKG